MIVADNVSRAYDVPGGPPLFVVRQVDLVVNQGEMLVLSGPSGAGKSTLLALLGAMDLPTSGTVTIAGRCTSNCSDLRLSEVRRKIGYLFQDAPMLWRHSVLANVVQPLIPWGISRNDRVVAGRRALDLVGLPGIEDASPGRLSGGERQRVALARALVAQPEVLVVDEPTSQLDSDATEHVVALLARMRADGVAVIIASHDRDAWTTADRVCRLEAGRLVHN